MTFSSDDEQALDIICSPTAVKVCLVRERLLGSHATRQGESGNSSNIIRDVMSGANFWPSQEGAHEPSKRMLLGELDLRKSLGIDIENGHDAFPLGAFPDTFVSQRSLVIVKNVNSS